MDWDCGYYLWRMYCYTWIIAFMEGSCTVMWKTINYAPEYLPEMLEMAKEHYGSENDIASSRFITYQYFKNPEGNAFIDLAWDEENEKLAGQYVVWPMKFTVNGMKTPCVHSLNTLTRAEYRGQGIFTGLAKKTYDHASQEGKAFCYGTPNPNSYPGFIKKLGFTDLGRIPLYLRPLHPSEMVREFLNSVPLSIAAYLFNNFFKIRPVKRIEGIEIVRMTVDNITFSDMLWEKIQKKYPVINTRDSEFLKFRYLNMPRRKYYPYFLIQNGQPIAFAVGRIMEVAGMQCGMLADFIFAPGYAQQANILLRFMLRLMQNQGASIAGSLMLMHTEEASLLRKNGFFCCPKRLEPQPFPLIIKIFDPSLNKTGIKDLSNWFFCMGDYDVI